MVKCSSVLLYFLLSAQVIFSSPGYSRARSWHAAQDLKHDASRGSARGHRKQTGAKVQGKSLQESQAQSKKNNNFMNLEKILFDRDELKKYVLDYLQKNQAYNQDITTTTDGERSLSHKNLHSTLKHHHERLDSPKSSIKTKHKRIDHKIKSYHRNDPSSHVEDHSAHKREKIAPKHGSTQPHSQHDHDEKLQRSLDKMPLPIYYSVKEDDGKQSYIWSYPSSFGYKGDKVRFRTGKIHSDNNKGISREKSDASVKKNLKVHQKARKHGTNVNKSPSVSQFPNSRRHGKSRYKKVTGHTEKTTTHKDKVKPKANNDHKSKSEKDRKYPAHNKEISGTKRNEMVEGKHKIQQKARKHKDDEKYLSSARAIPYSHHQRETEATKDTGNKKQTKKYRNNVKHKANDVQKGKNMGKHSAHSGTIGNARVGGNHKIYQKGKKHENNANHLSTVRTLPSSHRHGISEHKSIQKEKKTKCRDKTKHKANDDHKDKNGLAHKKSNKRDFIAVVPPKTLKIEGFNVERIHTHSSHTKKKTAIFDRHTHVINGKKSKAHRTHKTLDEQNAGSKSNIASKSHRHDHHGKGEEVPKMFHLQKEAQKPLTSHGNRNHDHNDRVQKSSVHKSSKESNASRKSSVGPTSHKRHPDKGKHHDQGHKKSTVHQDETLTAHKRKKASREKDKDFSPSWKSLDKRPIPSWYDEAKFGIFVHWGLYSVPSFDNEWFWFKWKGKQLQQYVDFMEKNYAPGFSYEEFAPMFKAEFFNATQWAQLVARSGARYFVFTSKHHEGFTNWNSSVAWNWNSVDVGPHRNIVDELARAFRNLSDPQVTFGLYYSLFEWFNPHYLKDKANGFKTDEYIQAVVKPQLHDLINTYKPDYLWTDGEWEANATYWKSEEFLTWLFNKSPVKDTVVVNDRWGRGCRCQHGGVYTGRDRFNPGKLQKMKWENAMTIDRRSWGFRREANLKDYFRIDELIKQLVTTVSCGGNLLMNVGPASDGTIAPIFQERLTQMGDWLKVNGDAIYKTKPWRAQNDSISGDVWYTSKRNNVFAIALKWPRSGKLVLGDVTSTSKTSVKMLGTKKNLKWTKHESKHKGKKSGIVVHVPAIPVSDLPCLWAWVFKFSHIK